jgi:hypothetical protein
MTTPAASLSLRSLDRSAADAAPNPRPGGAEGHDHRPDHRHAPADDLGRSHDDGSAHGHGHGHDHGHDHVHGHGHGGGVAQGSGHRHGPLGEPLRFSLVRASVATRLALAGAMSAFIWAAVLWARLPIGS